jgi:ribosomal protein L40E
MSLFRQWVCRYCQHLNLEGHETCRKCGRHRNPERPRTETRRELS